MKASATRFSAAAPQAASVAPRSSHQPAREHASPGQAAQTALKRLNGGNPLPLPTRARMERSFGRPFADVRVHHGAEAAKTTRAHGAEALTIGRNIAFGAGKYRPGSEAGDRLLAHELAHVVQQGSTVSGVAQASSEVSTAADPAEQQADAAAARVMRGEPAGIRPGMHAVTTRQRVLRKAMAGTMPMVSAPFAMPRLNSVVQGAAHAAATRALATPGAPTEPASEQPAEKEAQAEPADTKAAAAPQAAPDSLAAATATAPAAEPAIKPAPAADLAEVSDEKQAAEQAKAAGAEAQVEPGAAEKGPAKNEKAPASPGDDPSFRRVIRRVRAVAAQQAHNTAAERKAAEAQAAAMGPPNEVASKAADRQVAKMAEQKPKAFDREKFKAALLKKIRQIDPQSAEDVDSFKRSGKSAEIKNGITAEVTASKKDSASAIQSTTEEAPSTAGIQPKPVTPQPPTEPGPPPPDLGAKAAAPKPKSDAEVSLESSKAEIAGKWAESGLSARRLRNAQEPLCDKAIESRRQVEDNVDNAPAGYRAQEQAMLAGARSNAATSAAKGTGEMYASRGEQFAKIAGEQDTTRSKDTGKQGEVSGKIQGIYDGTKSKVEKRLEKLDTDVNTTFDGGAEKARKFFDFSVEIKKNAWRAKHQVKAFLNDIGFPADLQELYNEARNEYIDLMDGVIDSVAEVVETGLLDAKQLIDDGRHEIETYVASLPDDLKKIGEDAASQIQSQFDDLESNVRDRERQLVDSLAQKYVDQLAAVDQAIEAMKTEDRGFVGRAIDDANGALEIYEKIKALLARFGDIVDQILDDPGAFLDNLIAGIKAGLSGFIGNIWQHLKKGLMEWLFGALAAAGIQIPESFDLKSILKLVMQVMGVTYASIRARAVKLVGEPLVASMETAVEIFQTLRTEGIAGLWSWIKDKVGDLKSMVLDGIMSWVKEKVIVAGITWIMGLLNPAGALIKIANAIVKIVNFFMTRGAQIMALVDAVLNSLSAIASRNIGAMASAIENALARAIPVTIGFLASLLGLGGVSEMIRAQIDRARAPVDKAIDKTIAWIVEKGKKLGRFVAQAGVPQDPKKRLQLASQAAAAAARRLRGRATRGLLEPLLRTIKTRYGLSSIEPYERSGTWWVKAKINPEKDSDTGVSSTSAAPDTVADRIRRIRGNLKKAEEYLERTEERARSQPPPGPLPQPPSGPSPQPAPGRVPGQPRQAGQGYRKDDAEGDRLKAVSWPCPTGRRYDEILRLIAVAPGSKTKGGIDVPDFIPEKFVKNKKRLVSLGEGNSAFIRTILERGEAGGGTPESHAIDILYLKDYRSRLGPEALKNIERYPNNYHGGSFSDYNIVADEVVSVQGVTNDLRPPTGKPVSTAYIIKVLANILANLRPGGVARIVPNPYIKDLDNIMGELKKMSGLRDYAETRSNISSALVLLKEMR